MCRTLGTILHGIWLSPWILSSLQNTMWIVSAFPVVSTSWDPNSRFIIRKSNSCAASTSTCLSATSSSNNNNNNNNKAGTTKSKRKSGTASVAANKKGGFGRPSKDPAASVDSSYTDDDYAIFPALELAVRNTLVPAVVDSLTSSSSTKMMMTNEIYQRLDQIYGFPNFNYETIRPEDWGSCQKEDDTASLSFKDTASKTTTTTTTTKGSGLDDLLRNESPSIGNSDLDSLLAAATGGVASKSITSSSSSSQPKLASIAQCVSRLPPFENIHVRHVDPLVLSIDNFFTDDECDSYIEASLKHKTSRGRVMMSRSPTVGKDATAKAQRTSTTFYHMYQGVPELMSRASRLLGLSDINHWEEPQTVRYRRGEKFTWHLDALGPMERQKNSAGQRTATLLVYLTSLQDKEGGSTVFRDLGNHANEAYLHVQPRKGSALLFFPAAGGIPDCPYDIRTLHSGQVVAEDSQNDKWIAQLWLREKPYFPPTAPPGNRHADALSAIAAYCEQNSDQNLQ